MNQTVKKITNDEFIDFQYGNQKAFRKIFDVYHKLIYNYAYKFSKRHEDAEELVQEAFVTLFLNREKVENPEGLYPYLFVITKRLTISAFRKRVLESKFDHHLKYSWKEECETTEDTLNTNELSGIWNAAIESLPQRQKEVYELNKMDGLSYQEIAERLGVSKNTVKNQLITASRAIRLMLKDVYLLLLLIKTLW